MGVNLDRFWHAINYWKTCPLRVAAISSSGRIRPRLTANALMPDAGICLEPLVSTTGDLSLTRERIILPFRTPNSERQIQGDTPRATNVIRYSDARMQHILIADLFAGWRLRPDRPLPLTANHIGLSLGSGWWHRSGIKENG